MRVKKTHVVDSPSTGHQYNNRQLAHVFSDGCSVGCNAVLSLKFRPHRATRTPHHQHRTGVIHGTGLIPQHSKGSKNYTNDQKFKGALQNMGVRAHAHNNIVQGALARTMRGCWARNPRAC
jgi:hypothetical protein